MASSKEVLKDWLKEGHTVPQESIDSLYGMQALTNDLAEKRFLDKYGNIEPFRKAERIEDPVIPTLDVILDNIPKKDGDKRSKYEIFLQDFPKKAPEWKKKFTKDPSWGERGWNTVYDVWKKVSNWQMQDDIVKARRDAIPFAARMLSSVFAPRVTEDIINTGDWHAKDALLDLGGNALMAIPGAGVTGLLGKAGARVAPGVIRYFSGPGRNIAEGALKGAGRMSGNILGNAFAPFAQEALDAAAYDENDEGMEHRADFSLGDAAIGTAINQGVNRGLMRMVGPMIDRYSVGGMARGGMATARNFLDKLGVPFEKKGDEFAEAVAANMKKPVAEAGQITKEGISSARLGSDPVLKSITKEALEKEIEKQAVLDAIESGAIKVYPKDLATQGIQDDTKAALLDEILKKAQEAGPDAIHGSDMAADLNKLFNKEGVGVNVTDIFEVPKSIPIDLKRQTLNKNMSDEVMKASIGEDKIKQALQENPYDFINYATWHAKDPVSGASRSEKILNVLNQAVPSWVVNQLGTESASDALLSQTPAIKKKLKAESVKTHQAPKDRQASADVLKVIGNGGLTAEDQKYLNAIAKNPEIMRIGYKDDPNGFKMWLLERGNELLMGTRAARPTFGVE